MRLGSMKIYADVCSEYVCGCLCVLCVVLQVKGVPAMPVSFSLMFWFEKTMDHRRWTENINPTGKNTLLFC